MAPEAAPVPPPSNTPEGATRGTGWLVRLGGLGLVAGVLVGALRQLGDFDLPWHLATGRALATQGFQVASHDHFSYTYTGAPLRLEIVPNDTVFARLFVDDVNHGE